MVALGLVESRTKAQALIMAGAVLVDDRPITKAGAPVKDEAVIRLRAGSEQAYVSRGGEKLEGAVRHFGLRFDGDVVMDIGASTGGFTDCVLQYGAGRVYAVDVGYGQLAWSLRQDPRVVNIERTNIRYLEAEQIPEPIDTVVIDVSFISLQLVLPAAWRFMRPGGRCFAMIKPQFEAGKEGVGKGGVVRDPKVREDTIQGIIQFAQEQGFRFQGGVDSSLAGPKGNLEYFAWFSKPLVEPSKEA